MTLDRTKHGFLPAVLAISSLLALLFIFHGLSERRREYLVTTTTEAVTAYYEGVYLFTRSPWNRVDLEHAEQKFRQAANLGLAHGNYGIACVIYRIRDQARSKEAFDNLTYAVSHHVVEAMPVLATYYMDGRDTPLDRDKGVSLITAAAALTHISMEPTATYYAPQVKTYNHIQKSLNPNLCGPPILVDLGSRKALRNIPGTIFDLENSLDLIVPDSNSRDDR